MTQAIFIETAKAEAITAEGKRRRLNVSGVLKILGVSRTDYYSFKHRKPSERQMNKEKIEDKIIDIYDESHQNYGAPKITQKLREIGEKISEKTVGNSLIKREWINRYKILDYKHAEKLVFEYIETFYNTVRIHSHCGYLSPNKYEDKYYTGIIRKACSFLGNKIYSNFKINSIMS